jgi:hypothetical protein
MPIVRFCRNAFALRSVPGCTRVLPAAAHAGKTALAAFWLGMAIVSAAAADRPAASADAAEVAAQNCLLPAQIHRVGSITMVMPRRAVALPAAECVARGGEPIAGAPAN